MLCSKSAVFHFVDAIFLATVFLSQSVVFNYFIIKNFNKSSLPFLWFLGDFLCLLVFSLTLFLAFQTDYKKKRKERLQTSATNSNSILSNRPNSPQGMDDESEDKPLMLGCFGHVLKLPVSYMTWIVYSTIVIAKLVVLVKADIPQQFNTYEASILKISIATSSIIFYLLVEAHYDSHDDPVRNTAISAVSFSTAIELLDTTTFFSLLMESETHLMYSYSFENFILTLTAVNLMLPSLTLYKLTVSNFGKTYPVSLEVLCKALHFLLINLAYCGVRLYLRNWYASADTSVFFIKNIYSMISFIRGLYPDLLKLEKEWERSVYIKRIVQLFQCHGNVAVSANGNSKSLTEIHDGESIPMQRSQPATSRNYNDNQSVA